MPDAAHTATDTDTHAANLDCVSVIVPTLNAAATLPACLAALGVVGEIVVVDGGSDDRTHAVALGAGAHLTVAPHGRGAQLDAGARAATRDWFLFLHADTVLETRWRGDVARFVTEPPNLERAAYFRFSLDADSAPARRLERLVAWRAGMLGLPYGDQGLLIHRDLYHRLGGFPHWPLMEDVDLARRIGRKRLSQFESRAVTSAEKWRRDGWLLRSARNLLCLALYFLKVSPWTIRRIYG